MRSAVVLLWFLSPAAHAAVYTVDTSSDAALSACTPAPADCSLRGAISAANATPEADEIGFALTTADAGYQSATQHWRIAVGEVALPAITSPLFIDGSTQPGAMLNGRTPAQGGLDGVLKVELRAVGATAMQQIGLAIGGDFDQPASRFRGLAIGGFGTQILLGGSAAHRVEGCYLGTDVSGQISADAQPNANSVGLRVQGPGPYQIGGLTPAARNLIAGVRHGVLTFTASQGLRIEGNLLGTDASGLQRIGFRGDAIGIGREWTHGRLGGSDPAARNVIAGAAFSGLRLDAGLAGAYVGTRIEGNFFGTDAFGHAAIGNGLNPQSPTQGQPTLIATGQHCEIAIGGLAEGQANRFAHGGAAAIQVDACVGLSSPFNQFRRNRGPAIDTVSGGAAVGPTANDPGDADEGGNRLQNHAELGLPAGFLPQGGVTVPLTVRVDTATASAGYPLRVDFYRADQGGGSRTWLGSDSIPATAAGQPRTPTLIAPDGGNLLPLTALVTDAAGNSSEFTPMLGDAIGAGGFEGPR